MRIAVEKLFDGQRLLTRQSVEVVDGYIQGVYPASSDEVLHPGILTAGFIDTQVNGGGGVLFNQQPDIQALDTIFQAHHQFGTTAMLPTLITDSLQVMQQAAEAISQAVAEQKAGILGIHFEGPHLSVPKRGVHSTEHIRPLTDSEMQLFFRQDLGLKILTLAPENVPPDMIKELVAQNVIVCLGHSNADYDTVVQALEAGARGFTHLFNAMSPLQSRAPGMIGAALEHQQSWCGIIADGHHLHPAGLHIAQKCKGEQLMLVTDAMALTGTNTDHFQLLGETIYRRGDKLLGPEGQLAGSTLDMASAIRYSRQQNLALEVCLNMASRNPAEFLQLKNMGSVTSGKRADLVLLNNELEVQQCWLKGIVTFTK